MVDAPTESLEELLRALAREHNLRGRLRVLGRSWTLLRSLSRAQREQVALRMGSKWAWERVEKAFLEDGELSENERLVGRAFERMGDADPGELRKIARTIKEGDGRAAKDLLMLTLTEALEDAADDEEEERIEAEPPTAEGETGAEPGPPAPQPAPPTVPRVESGPAPASSDRTEPAPPRQVPALEPGTEPLAPAEPHVDVPVAATSSDDGVDRLRVLRALHASERPAADLGRAGRAELLESLGGGWASRRALSRMITARSLDGVDEALGLIRRLARPGEQIWCLADLLHHWELDRNEIDSVLDAAPSDAARRRLARRSRAA